jgi:type II secretory pathway pseudopilin PulG
MFSRVIGISIAVMATVVLATVAQAQNVSRLVAERQQILNQFNACRNAAANYAQKQAIWAAQGRVLPPLQCTNYYPQWTTRVWQYDIAIARANGDRRPACQIEPLPGCENYRN